MSKFQNLFKEAVKKSERTLYSISKETDIERTFLSKMISGKRKMSFDNFISIMNAVCVNEEEQKALIESYITDIFGRDKFEGYFYNLTSDIISDTSDKRPAIAEFDGDFIELKSKLELFNFAEFVVSNSSLTNRIFTNFPARELLSIAVKKEACDFRCIINTNVKDKSISIFDLIKLNLICCISYIDESTASNKNNREFYPFYIITDDSVLFANKTLDTGYYIKNPQLADLYAKNFINICKLMKVNSQIHDDILNVKEPISKYLFNKQVHRVINNSLSVVAFMTRDDWAELARDELPNREYLIDTTYEYYQEYFSSIGTHIFVAPIDGLDDFCENGAVHEMPVEYSKPLSVETRIALLERIVDYMNNRLDKYKLNFIRNKNFEKNDILLTIESVFDSNADYKTTLITMSCSEAQKTYFPGNYLFLSTNLDAITEYNTFFDILRISDKMMTKDETVAALQDRILRLKYNSAKANADK